MLELGPGERLPGPLTAEGVRFGSLRTLGSHSLPEHRRTVGRGPCAQQVQ